MSVFSNCCPKCSAGAIYKSFMELNQKCPQCGFQFERERGYFVGALFLNYMTLALSTVPTLIITIFIIGLDPILSGVLSFLQILALSPFTLHFSRLIWIHMDHLSDPTAR